MTFYPFLGMSLDSAVIVQRAEDLSGDLDSTKLYLIDGQIDMRDISITVPAGGLYMSGLSFDVSKLYSSEDNYTMFVSPVGGSGNFIGVNYTIDVSGTGSQVYDLVSFSGDEAFEFNAINYDNCSSLGSINNYRQGLETGTGRFGGQPSLELIGEWLGGYRISTSIVRGIDNAMTDPLFKAGAGFTMSSRFRTDMNADLGSTAAFADFSTANFTKPSLFQMDGAIITRNNIADPSDTTVFPNILASDLQSYFRDSIGIANTFVGGSMRLSVEATTSILAANTYYDIAGTWTPYDLQHFDSPSNGQLRNIGDSPREFTIFADLTLSGTANDVVDIRVTKWDDSAGVFEEVYRQQRVINNNSGPRDVGFYNIIVGFTLDQFDYIKVQVENTTAANDVILETDSFFTVVER